MRTSEPSVITIKLKKTSSLSGRLVDEHGQPVAGQLVEIWSAHQGNWLGANLVGFQQGPLLTGTDGSFRTPANLQQGRSYRLAIRAAGKDPIFSEWTTIPETPHALPPMVQRSLRTVRGHVVDRQGKPVAGARRLPIRRWTRAYRDDNRRRRPVLAGRVPARACVRVRPQRRVSILWPDDQAERREREDRAHSRWRSAGTCHEAATATDLARRILGPRPALLEPCWKVVALSDDDTKFRYLNALLPADPGGVLEKLSSLKFNSELWRLRLLREAVLVLAERDKDEAASLAESIPDPATRAGALTDLADRIPAAQRERKVALLHQALEQAERLWQQTENLWRIGFSDAILCWRFAGVDPAQARRIIAARSIAQRLMPQAHFYLALGAKDRDETISRQSVRLALQALDRVMEESPEKYMNAAGRLLSVVEQIDPALCRRYSGATWRHACRMATRDCPGPMVQPI